MGIDDPGWKPAWRGLVIGVVPWLLRGMATGGRLGNALVTVRTVFLSFCVQLVAFGAVIGILDATTSRSPRSVATALVLIAIGAVVSFVGRRFEKPLACTTDQTLATTYRQRFFLRVACAESAALLGFIAFFQTYQWWAYPAGALFTAIGLRRAAPTAERLAREQEALNAGQCERRLLDALTLP